MDKNTSGNKWRIFAFDRTSNLPVTGDAANITAKIALDHGAATALADVNPLEVEDGYYLFDLTQAETNADVLDLFPESSTTNVQVIGTPPTLDTLDNDALASLIAGKLQSSSLQLLTPNGFIIDQELRLVQRDDYLAADGRAWETQITLAGVDFTVATVVMGAGTTPGTPTITGTPSLTNKAVGSCTLRLEFTSAQLNQDPGTYQWDATITADGSKLTVVNGNLILEPRYNS